jgi:aminoglycoside phosphotransferase family enzyme
MHGDLHTRNIMVMRDKTRRREYVFKLIDLEKVRPEGDMAHDAGQLLADLDFLTVNAQRPLGRSAVTLREYIREDYLRLAKERRDENFGLRLELAMARAYMRITKGRFKRTLRHLDNREYAQANDFIFDTLGLISSTQDTLERLMEMLE